MKLKVIGFKFINFVNQETGELIDGVKCFLAIPDSDFVGLGVSAPFVRAGTDLYDKIKKSGRDFAGADKCEIDFIPGTNGKTKLADINLIK